MNQKFFERNTLNVAQELLGKFLCRQRGRNVLCFMIHETEVYDGFRDKASHARRGKTARNFPMFGEAGRWYVYFTYGMHWMLNIVTGRKGYPAAVLIRGLNGPGPLKISRSKRLTPRLRRSGSLTGPAKLTKFLKIDKRFNNKPAIRKTGLWIEDRGAKLPISHIQRTARIGVGYAQEWAKKKYRFIIVE